MLSGRRKLRVLITSPSLDTSKNVGGISNLTRLFISKNKDINFIHFVVGKEDSQKRNFKWFCSQFSLLINFSKILKQKEIEISHINYPLLGLAIIINFFLIIISKLHGIKTIVHLRGGSFSMNKNIHKYQKFIIKQSLKLSDKVITLGQKEKRFFVDFYKIDENKFFVLPNSVEIPNWNLIENKLSKIEKKSFFKILFLGRIDKDKGLSEILLAFRAIDLTIDFKFILAGTGPDNDWFLNECNTILGEKFEYLGVLDYSEKQKVFLDTDIFILPSYYEGLPNALLESMAYGLVPIVTPVGSIPEVVTDNIEGFLISINDSNSLKDKIQLLINDNQLMKEMATNSYKKIELNYSIFDYIEKYNSLYNELILNHSQD